MALTATKVRHLAEPGRYGDGRGLYLRIRPNGAKSWVLRIIIDGHRRDVTLGRYPEVTLAKARELAIANRVNVAAGRDPLAERRGDVPTFADAARQKHAIELPGWRNDHHAADWLRSLETYAFPKIGRMPVDRIGRADVIRCLAPIWHDKPDRARRVRTRIRKVLQWSIAEGHIESTRVNPAGEVIDEAFPKVPKLKRHLRALAYPELPAALDTIEASRASLAARSCLRFLILTAARSGEARGATWAEIDLDGREWRIPAERMKAGVEHRVPLSDAALDVLRDVAPLREDGDYVFPSPSKAGRALSDMTLTKLLRDNGLAEHTTVHGFRTSFRTWAEERTEARHKVMELSLAHQVGSDVERAYARSDLLERRRHLMDKWAAFATDTAPATVVDIRAGRRA